MKSIRTFASPMAILAGTILSLSVGEATAQIRHLQIVVEDLDKSAAECGISERGITDAATAELRRTHIGLAPEANPMLSIEPLFQTMVLSSSQPYCVYSLLVSVVYAEAVRTRGKFRSTQANDFVYLCRVHTFGADEKSQFAGEFYKILARDIGECLSELLY